MGYNNTSAKVANELVHQVNIGNKKDVYQYISNSYINSFNGFHYISINKVIIISGETNDDGTSIIWDFRFYNKCAIDRINAFFDIVLNRPGRFYWNGFPYYIDSVGIIKTLNVNKLYYIKDFI